MGPLLLTLMLVSGAPRTTAGVGTIDSVCTAPKGRANQVRTRFFAEVSGAILPKGRQGHWRELDSEAELHALSEGAHPPNTEATVQSLRDGTLVSMYFQDASESWAHVVDYCFLAKGPLARLRGTFNSLTAVGAGPGIRRRRTIYYDAQGAVLRSKTGVFDIQTDKPLTTAAFIDEEDPLYPSLRALPFSADLLPSAPVADVDPDGFAATVRERLPSVKACWDRAVKATPGLAGKAIGRWTVDVTGKVTAFSWQTDEIKSAVFGTCARKAIESWRFPARQEPTTVSFPFVFAGAGLSLAP